MLPSENQSFFEQLSYVLNNPAHVGNESESLKSLLGSGNTSNFFDKVHSFLLQEFPRKSLNSLSIPRHYLEVCSNIYSEMPGRLQDSYYLVLPLDGFFKFCASPAILLIKIVLALTQLSLLAAFVVLELGIAFLQAYVFVILTTIYINDSLQLH